MYSGEEMVAALAEVGITHVAWIPDSMMGEWEAALEASDTIELIRVCREGEAWAVAAGLWIGGQRPLVMIQCTGLFESGDSMRNALFDLKIPLPAIVGYRSYLVKDSPDTAKQFTEPVLAMWGVATVLVDSEEAKPKLAAHLIACRDAAKAGVVLVAEGRM